MAGRRMSARRLSMSRAAKRELREKKRKKKLGGPDRKREVRRKLVWLLFLAGLVIFGFFLGLVLANLDFFAG